MQNLRLSTRTTIPRTGYSCWEITQFTPTSTCAGRETRAARRGREVGQKIPMQREWNDSHPIYRQLRDRVAALLPNGGVKEHDPLPSVRTVAADYRSTARTVS